MSFLKKFLVFVLVFFSAFLLVGCTDDDARTRLDELNSLIEDLQAQLDASEDVVADLQELLDEADENLNTAVKGLLSNLTAGGVIQPESVSAVLKNESTVLGVANQDGEYNVDTGSKIALEFVITAKYVLNGVEYEFEVENAWYQVDYFWANTWDYNDGIVWDEEANTIEFLLPGSYGLALYALDNPYKVSYDEDGNRDSDYPAAEAFDSGEIVPGSVLYEIVVADPLDLLTSDDKKLLELNVAATDQLKIEGYGEEYVFVKLESSDTAIATVDATGKVTAVAEGKAVIYADVKKKGAAEADPVRKLALPVTVLKPLTGTLAGGTAGKYVDLKYVNADTKAKILAYMERYLINEGASIPVINNSGLVVYSERVNFLTKEYVPLMGHGPTGVALETGTATGTTADPAYRMWTSADPGTLNHLAYADSIESDFMTLLLGSLFSFDWELDNDGYGVGWEVEAEMAEKLAYPVEKKDGVWTTVAGWNGLTTAKSWKFDLREDLKWQNGDPIKADDFLYTFKEALDGNLAYKRANLFYGSSLPIEGAEDYYKGKGSVDWNTVGIEKVDDYSYVITYKNPSLQWDVIYNNSGFMFTPVHKATYEQDKSKYGTSMDKFMSSGPYKLSYWEKGKEYRFTKNDQYFIWNAQDEDPEGANYCAVAAPILENYSYTIVKDNNAALKLFEEGKLDVTSVPASAYDSVVGKYQERWTPGATSFRLSVNRLTQAEIDAQYGVGAWTAKPILQEDDFMWALYFGLNRAGVQTVSKTQTAWSSYFTNAYAIVAPTADGLEMETYRNTEWGKKVYTGIYDDDLPLAEDAIGYNQAMAVSRYVAAVQSMLDKNVIELGTDENPTKITIEIAHFDGATHEAVYGYVVQNYNDLFNNTAEFGKKIKFEAISAPQPGMDVYYVKQMTGQYDLAQAGISGGLLDPMGFMECFCDDNRSGLLLSLGFDSHNPSILIDLGDVDGDGTADGEMWWSFDALYSAFNGKTFVKNGMEAKAPEETPTE
ncbi:MAG: ABC transporter substrate-binding protein [Bacilli bacterium]|nr:ABC transporter substrate-binding protein [Bacilli bacterium]